MSAGQITCPIVFRGANGAAAGVAAQHSQCFAAWYASVPGLKVSTAGWVVGWSERVGGRLGRVKAGPLGFSRQHCACTATPGAGRMPTIPASLLTCTAAPASAGGGAV